MLDNLIITCEHAGNHIPKRYQPLFAEYGELLGSHRGYDPGALMAAKKMAEHFEAPLFSTSISRLLIDCNRSLRHHHLFSDISKALPDSEREQIINDVYLPYRNQVIQTIRAFKNQRRKVIHISVHSFTPSLNGANRNADIGLLYDPSRAPEHKFCTHWRNELRKQAPRWAVRMNYPYRGIADGFATALRKQFTKNQYIGVELELNHGLWFEDKPQWNAMVNDCINALSADLPQATP
ncbi:MAG: N-formylglutamate amidohydrolase [Candidatus Hinthialibacter antarcticus]|nr:N-formylglutamate amidohydrolase [Candidatus Hinthialibacter antarcticus]